MSILFNRKIFPSVTFYSRFVLIVIWPPSLSDSFTWLTQCFRASRCPLSSGDVNLLVACENVSFMQECQRQLPEECHHRRQLFVSAPDSASSNPNPTRSSPPTRLENLIDMLTTVLVRRLQIMQLLIQIRDVRLQLSRLG